MLVASDEEGIDAAVRYLSYLPGNFERPTRPPAPASAAWVGRRGRAPQSETPIGELIPADENKPFDMRLLLDALVDADSFMEIHARWAKELIVGFARLDGRRRRDRRQPAEGKGGVLFVDSADKAARFIWTCNAFNVPLLFLADVPGFMIGTQVERQGIIRHGAKMISAVTEATVPKISVIVRKAYGAGLYAMAGPGLRPRLLPRAAERLDRGDGPAGGDQRRLLQPAAGDRRRGRARRGDRASCVREYAADIDILHLASELVVDAVDRARGPARRADPPLRAGGSLAVASGRPGTTRSPRSEDVSWRYARRPVPVRVVET